MRNLQRADFLPTGIVGMGREQERKLCRKQGAESDTTQLLAKTQPLEIRNRDPAKYWIRLGYSTPA